MDSKEISKFISKNLNFFFNLIAMLGVVFLIIGIAMSISNASFAKHSQETSATIVELKDDRFLSSDKTVYIRYLVGHEEYRGELGCYDESMEVGDSVRILYRENNPAVIRWVNYVSNSTAYIVWGIVLIVLGVGLRMWRGASVLSYKKRRAASRARQNKYKDIQM
ncbi:MAG: DUF3592 domain-containing protein [Clostridia bacterium]|nr:DUF3592 domain-containing protein [Clostridia bacterium]